MLRNGVWWLEDRQSRNGTRLNGIEVEQPVIVTDSDIIHIGTKHFRLNLE
jgi:pSer/pThr/pTyr-binding forkhead associated (FHA) protein